MKELLQRIAANSHKVPGLKVDVWKPSIDDVLAQITLPGPKYYYIRQRCTPREFRKYFLMIVDAIEAAGLDRFERYVLPPQSDGYPTKWDWSSTRLGGQNFANPQEHIALAECLAAVMEALPEVE